MTSSFLQQLDLCAQDGSIPDKYRVLVSQFYRNYLAAVGPSEPSHEALFLSYLELIREQCINPYSFSPYHQKVRTPFDHYQFGIDLVKPLIHTEASTLSGLPSLKLAIALQEKGDNVIFLANHQIEADPHAISIALEAFPRFAEEMIFVAGERVLTDPLAVPFSLGRNLLCIYSKRYIDTPPEQKAKKQQHNKSAMQLMSELLSEGGKAVYVAPSGGRDRPNAQGVFEVAPFDPQSIEMFYLMAQKSCHPTHFYPLSLKTHEVLPPPETIQIELGEVRTMKKAPIHLHFAPEIDMEHFPGSDNPDRRARRQSRALFIWNIVRTLYEAFPKSIG